MYNTCIINIWCVCKFVMAVTLYNKLTITCIALIVFIAKLPSLCVCTFTLHCDVFLYCDMWFFSVCSYFVALYIFVYHLVVY